MPSKPTPTLHSKTSNEESENKNAIDDMGLNEIISPEGVEERVELEIGFRLTLTGGGKFRIYDLERGRDSARSIGIYDDKEGATEAFGMFMAIRGTMIADPKRAAKMISDIFKNS